MEPVALGFTTVLIMGLVFGAGPCNVACLPYLGPVFLGPGRGWAHVVAFSGGRLAGYVVIAAAAGAFGQVATRALESRAAGIVLGIAAVIAGLLLLRRKRQCAGGGAQAVPAQASVTFHSPKQRRLLPFALFGMGLGMAFNPCVPLATVLLAAAVSASPWAGAWLGLGFGLGAILVPALVFGWFVAHFGREVRAHVGRWLPRVEQGAGVLMILLGVFTMAGWVQP